jgi:arylsulfatase A-like enzyme
VAPKKYWDLYQRQNMPVAIFQKASENGVDMAYHNAGELSAYTDIVPLASFTDQKNIGLTLSLDKQKELIHGYYSSVSYTDAQVGILLNALDSLGLSDNTIIVLWGDHGWHLGDHNLWCKHTNFEQATHAPLLIAAPGLAASKTTSPSEFIDIFPTLCDLSGLSIPSYLDGKSLVPMMRNPNAKVKDFSVSQYPRSGANSETDRLGFADSKLMGYSIRTNQYRLTIWMKDFFKSTQPFNKNLIVGTELYDYKNDPNETVNVYTDKNYAAVSKKMYDNMIAYFKSQQKK